jgi:hypothetical protein
VSGLGGAGIVMLTPAESLGLAGAALDSRVRRAINHISDATLARIADRLLADAADNGMVYERDGRSDPVRIMLRPLLATPAVLTDLCLAAAQSSR